MFRRIQNPLVVTATTTLTTPKRVFLNSVVVVECLRTLTLTTTTTTTSCSISTNTTVLGRRTGTGHQLTGIKLPTPCTSTLRFLALSSSTVTSSSSCTSSSFSSVKTTTLIGTSISTTKSIHTKQEDNDDDEKNDRIDAPTVVATKTKTKKTTDSIVPTTTTMLSQILTSIEKVVASLAEKLGIMKYYKQLGMPFIVWWYSVYVTTGISIYGCIAYGGVDIISLIEEHTPMAFQDNFIIDYLSTLNDDTVGTAENSDADSDSITTDTTTTDTTTLISNTTKVNIMTAIAINKCCEPLRFPFVLYTSPPIIQWWKKKKKKTENKIKNNNNTHHKK